MTSLTKLDLPWDNHIQISIRAWSMSRAKELADKKSFSNPMDKTLFEEFLYGVLVDALTTFNDTYNRAYNEHVNSLLKMIDNYMDRIASPSPPVIIRQKGEQTK